jgi:hypothetical protein
MTKYSSDSNIKMTDFAIYNNIIHRAFCLHPQKQDIVERKQEIISKVAEFWNKRPDRILFIGFNPAILHASNREIFVAEITPMVSEWLTEQGVKFTEVELDNIAPVDIAVATDEYLTFAHDDQEQQQLISRLSRVADIVITTVKDYKNQDFKDREYSQPAIIRNDDVFTGFTELHNWDRVDRNAWDTSVYQLNRESCHCYGVYRRRALYFKQLAKFSRDFGAKEFLVHKNLMYKSLLKKNYEHVISIYYGD